MLRTCGSTVYHGGGIQWRKLLALWQPEKERDTLKPVRGWGLKIPFKDVPHHLTFSH